MKKNGFILLIFILCFVPLVFGQSEISIQIEVSALQKASNEQKLLALDYIKNALQQGYVNEDFILALEYLSLSRENRHDIRRNAVNSLSLIETSEAKDILIKVLLAELEPIVLQEAIKSLGIICINDNDDTISAISLVFRRFHATDPNNLIAIFTVDTFEKIVNKYNIENRYDIVNTLILISEGYYINPVKIRARELLEYVLNN
jgi:HEAT repeat protein